MSRRVIRAGMWVCGAAALVLAGALALSVVRPTWLDGRRWVAGVRSGSVEVAWSSAALKRQSIAYNLSYPEGNASILVAPKSAWRPSHETATVGVGTAAAPSAMYTLSVAYVPIWPWLVLSAGGSALLWWRAGKRIAPGHCGVCGYDVGGLGRCPECGLVVKLLGWLRARLGRRSVGPAVRG